MGLSALWLSSSSSSSLSGSILGKVDVGTDDALVLPRTFFLGLVTPFIGVSRLLPSLLFGWKGKAIVVLYAFFFLASVGLFVGWMFGFQGLKPLFYTTVLISGVILGSIRRQFRSRHRIHSNFVADYVGSLILWPQVILQLRHQSVHLPKSKLEEENLVGARNERDRDVAALSISKPVDKRNQLRRNDNLQSSFSHEEPKPAGSADRVRLKVFDDEEEEHV